MRFGCTRRTLAYTESYQKAEKAVYEAVARIHEPIRISVKMALTLPNPSQEGGAALVFAFIFSILQAGDRPTLDAANPVVTDYLPNT